MGSCFSCGRLCVVDEGSVDDNYLLGQQDGDYSTFRDPRVTSGFWEGEVSDLESSNVSFTTAPSKDSTEGETLLVNCETKNTKFHAEKVKRWFKMSSNRTEERVYDVEISSVVTHEGGSVNMNGVQLTCPPGAVANPVRIKLGLEEPYMYCGMTVDSGLQNDVIFATPIIKCQPSGRVFKKQVTLTIPLDSDKEGLTGALLVLHGSQTNKGEIFWEDITQNSEFDSEKSELKVEIDHFSIFAVLVRLTWLHAKEIVARFNLMPFKYTLSVLFKSNDHLSPFDELALLFMSQDIYQEELYREHSKSALTHLKSNGFEEVGNSLREDRNSVYTNESLTVSIQLCVDYKLANKQLERIEFPIDSSVWWSTGQIIKLPLQGSSTDAKILCGRIVVQGQHGHFRESHFCQQDHSTYVRRLLKVEKAIFNLKPVSKTLGFCDEEKWSQVVACWQSEDKQLKLILQSWQEKLTDKDGPGMLKTSLMRLEPEEYTVTERGQMHIEHLRELASKIVNLQHKDLTMMKYLGREIKAQCKSVLRDCCIEMATTEEDLKWATLAENHDNLLLIHGRISKDVAKKYDQMISSPEESIIANFLLILPHLVQIIKEIFRGERTPPVQTGLRGIAEEATLSNISSNIQDAIQNKNILRLFSEVCNILEYLCLNNRETNRPTEQISKAEIHHWGDSATISTMLHFLERFFEGSHMGRRLYKRLETFATFTRKVMSNPRFFEGHFLRDFLNVALSLLKFAEFDPSQLVRFELSKDLNASSNTRGNDSLKYDKSQDIFSQMFWFGKQSESELHLEALAHVHIDGDLRSIGAFETVIVLPESSSEAIDKLPIASLSVAVKREQDYWGNLSINLYATQKGNVIKALQYLEKELGEEVVNAKKQKVTRSHLKVRSFVKGKTVVGLRLTHKWRSETIGLDSNDFVALAGSTTAAEAGQLAPSKEPSVLPTSNDSTDGNDNVNSSDMDSSETESILRHLRKQSEPIEIHFHQNYLHGHVCVAGTNTNLNMQLPASLTENGV